MGNVRQHQTLMRRGTVSVRTEFRNPKFALQRSWDSGFVTRILLVTSSSPCCDDVSIHFCFGIAIPKASMFALEIWLSLTTY